MKIITSRDNPSYKELKQLASSTQAQRRAGRALLDGVHLAQSYLQHVGSPQLCVVAESAQSNPEVGALLARCSASPCMLLPDSLYRGLSQVQHGVGLLFVVETPHAPTPSAVTQRAVLLDQLQDPGNLGSILRSAAAAGIRQIYCSPGTAFSWSSKVLRAGMGAHFMLEIYEDVDLVALAQSMQIPLLATSSHAQHTLYEIDLSQPVAWLFGHEGQGVTEELLKLASHQIAIPQAPGVESLNVAAAAAVCFFETVRQSL
jgi:RNA methyltransferase, TrmH family